MAEQDETSPIFNPRHRIIGAVVLVVLAVLVIPLVLKNRGPELRPAAPAGVSSGSVAVPPPLPMTPGSNVPGTTVPSATMPAAAPPQPDAAVSQPQPQALTRPQPAPIPTGTAAPKSGSHRGVMAERVRHHAMAHHEVVHHEVRVAHGWIVQLGAFSRRDNALRVREKLIRHGFRVELARLRIRHRAVVCVRVGPVRNRAEARMLEAHIARQTGIKGVVLTYP